MSTPLKTVAALSLAGLIAVAVRVELAGQDQPPAAARGRGAPPAPPPAQPGHPMGKLIIWGDLASYDNPPTLPTHCLLTNRFKRGQRVGIRMTAIDGGSGET